MAWNRVKIVQHFNDPVKAATYKKKELSWQVHDIQLGVFTTQEQGEEEEEVHSFR